MTAEASLGVSQASNVVDLLDCHRARQKEQESARGEAKAKMKALPWDYQREIQS